MSTVESLTIGEIAAIEKYSGKKMTDFQDETAMDNRQASRSASRD